MNLGKINPKTIGGRIFFQHFISVKMTLIYLYKHKDFYKFEIP